MEDKKKILIVDDDQDMVEILSLFFQARGFQTEVATSGQEALTASRDKAPDVLLLDIMLPEIDGFKVLQGIRNRAETRTLPVIMISAKSNAADMDRAMKAGANDYLVKPFSRDRLLQIVQGVLQSDRGT